MINANELRIGNLVDLYDSVTGHNFVKVSVSILSANEFINPIQLTPEILGKCGYCKCSCRPNWDTDYNNDYDFEDVSLAGYDVFVKGNSFNIGKKGVLFYLVESQINSDESSSLYPIGNGFSCLHELQNLIFALTGEELQINL
jgi:hypothetical protein